MIGDRLGNWIIYKELGRGGMGQVYLAREELTGRQGAVKILAPALAQDIGFLQRFQREIEALRKLSHPLVVKFYEAGEDNGHYYYVMEYVEGESLERVLDKEKRLPWKEVLDIALQICRSLKHVHDHGVIHRDLKPANLLLTPDGLIKLTDFGIAKVFAAEHLTATGGIVGTAEYLSPEQAAGKPATPRSDLYSLGVVLYTLLVGRPPFTGPSHLDLLHKHRYAQFDPPQRIIPDMPHELDEIICSLLAKEPEQRPADALVLGKQLEKLRLKLERKSRPTSVNVDEEVTRADNALRPPRGRREGPATLMSRLMRQELDRQNKGGPLRRFINQPVVLTLALLACIGVLVYAFWPASAETLYEHGSALMQSESFADWKTAERDYFEPLDRLYPKHPYREQVDRYRRQIEAAEQASESAIPGEAERFYRQGERLREEGQLAAAERVWSNLVQVFTDIDSEAVWVRRARRGLLELEKAQLTNQRWEPVQQALNRARLLEKQGKRSEAQAICQGIVELYRDNPAAQMLVQQAQQELAKRAGKPK